ncbi:MAG: hypothetical protein IKC79_00320 [Clostridia bacterium]|nr:hypothetical protein [Clostridia bacterium]
MISQNSISIKDYAKMAKKRLSSGYWTVIREKRNELISNSSCTNIDKMQQAYTRRIERNLQSEMFTDDDTMLYKKVCKMQEQDTFVLNPISRLIDHSVYDKMSDNDKQLYILKLSNKYNELLERYNAEHNEKIGAL